MHVRKHDQLIDLGGSKETTAAVAGVAGKATRALRVRAGLAPRPTAGSVRGAAAGVTPVSSLQRGLHLGARLAGQGLLYAAGGHLVQASRLPLPANLVGLLLLLLLLGTGVVRPADLRETAHLVARHLAFFFIPFVVGLMAWAALVANGGVVIGLSLVGSAVVGVVTASLVAQGLMRRAP